MAGLHGPLPTLRPWPRGQTRTARGRRGSLLLRRIGLSPTTPGRSPGALPNPVNWNLSKARGLGGSEGWSPGWHLMGSRHRDVVLLDGLAARNATLLRHFGPPAFQPLGQL